ncbi:MAG: hypothetical protein K0U38_00205 [Epsilonproteobacteria bacterium]|nr:hypothetical protein [Campylobacterota bacterium]
MKKFIWSLSLFITLSMTSCGGGSEQAKELLTQLLQIVGIPHDIIVNICQDSNENEFCDVFEIEEVSVIKNNFFSKIVLGSDNTFELKNYDPNKKILLELQDQENVELNEGKFTLSYKGTSEEISILQSIVDAEQLNENDVKTVKTMDGKDTFDEVLLKSLMRNLNKFTNNNLTTSNAMKVNIEELGRVFNDDLPIKKLSSLIEIECKKDKVCIDALINDFTVNMVTEDQEVYTLAQASRIEKLLNDKLVEEFQCNKGEVRTVQHYGIEDIFSLENGRELPHPSNFLLRHLDKENLVPYDVNEKDKLFADTVAKLPIGITKGRIYIGFELSNGLLNAESKLLLGKFQADNSNTLFNANLRTLSQKGWLHQAVNSDANLTTDIYFNNFKDIEFADKQTLLSYLQTTNLFDVIVTDNTPVDFITVATCSQQDPREEIYDTLNRFTCQEEGSRLVQISGGTPDAFASTEDKKATPSPLLISTLEQAYKEYDEIQYNRPFIDSLTIPTSATISQVQFSVGVMPVAQSLFQNDTITLGSYELSNYGRYKLYGDGNDSVHSLWNQDITISNGERILQADLADINFTNGNNISLFNLIESNNELLDIFIHNDTSIDFTYLNICIKDD